MQPSLVRLIPFLLTLPPLHATSDRSAPQSSKPRDTAAAPLLITLISTLKSTLKHSRPSMALITFKPTVAAGHHLPHRPLPPIKGGDPRCYSPHILHSFSPPSELKHRLHRAPLLSHFITMTRPPHHCLSSSEA
jgi:hypothetical protein